MTSNYDNYNENQTNLLSEIKNTFIQIGKNIQSEIDQRIKSYINSLLYKNHANLFYFIPKNGIVEIEGGDYSGYRIIPNQPFFVKDKKLGNTLQFTTKLQTVISPINRIVTENNNNFFIIDIEFEKDFEYEDLTLWLNPDFTKKNSLLAISIIQNLLDKKASEHFAEIVYSDGSKTKKIINISKLKYQLKQIEIDMMTYHYPHMVSGFNVHIKDLFNYQYNKIKRITLFLKNSCEEDIHDDISELFKLNIVPIFNSYSGYSYAIKADMKFSSLKLRHEKNQHAEPLEILTVYENNKKIYDENYLFRGQNEYFFNFKNSMLEYNVILPDLNHKIEAVRMYAYALWADTIELSDNIYINSNELSSINCKLLPLNMSPAITNYKFHSERMFYLIERLDIEKIFSKSTFKSILEYLQLHSQDIKRFIELIENILFEKLENKLYVSIVTSSLSQDTMFIKFILELICSFIRNNSIIHIRSFSLDITGSNTKC